MFSYLKSETNRKRIVFFHNVGLFKTYPGGQFDDLTQFTPDDTHTRAVNVERIQSTRRGSNDTGHTNESTNERIENLSFT